MTIEETANHAIRFGEWLAERVICGSYGNSITIRVKLTVDGVEHEATPSYTAQELYTLFCNETYKATETKL